jgi:ATP-binding cassette subfamily B protein
MLQARTFRPWFLTWEQRYKTALSYREVHTGEIAPSLTQGLELRRVTVQFPGATHPALTEVNLRIERGATVAVVGESGSGKTTLLDLISGLVPASAGDLRLDGMDFGQVDREAWQGHLGVVTQDTPLYNASVLENVAWGDANADKARVESCLEAAHAAAFVQRLNQGLDTQVGERGGRLSGGERQRLGLARALYRRPWVLLLDEATSALDAESEAAVLGALRELKGSCTMLLVTHRLSAASIADDVIVLDAGRVVQRGTYAQLLADESGRFAALATAQGLVPAGS